MEGALTVTLRDLIAGLAESTLGYSCRFDFARNDRLIMTLL